MSMSDQITSTTTWFSHLTKGLKMINAVKLLPDARLPQRVPPDSHGPMVEVWDMVRAQGTEIVRLPFKFPPPHLSSSLHQHSPPPLPCIILLFGANATSKILTTVTIVFKISPTHLPCIRADRGTCALGTMLLKAIKKPRHSRLAATAMKVAVARSANSTGSRY